MTEMLGYMPPQDRILCIGDNIFTDLLGAQQQDYDCLFIQDGLYGETDMAHCRPRLFRRC